MPFRLQIPRTLYDRMLAQAATELPNECCGLLGGRIVVEDGSAPEKRLGKVEQCYPLINAAASPVEYDADSKGLIAAARDMRQRGIDILAIYHSHPTTDPVPSRKDLDRSYSDEVAHLIISLKTGEPQARGWWLSGHGFLEAEWECTNEPAAPW